MKGKKNTQRSTTRKTALENHFYEIGSLSPNASVTLSGEQPGLAVTAPTPRLCRTRRSRRASFLRLNFIYSRFCGNAGSPTAEEQLGRKSRVGTAPRHRGSHIPRSPAPRPSRPAPSISRPAPRPSQSTTLTIAMPSLLYSFMFSISLHIWFWNLWSRRIIFGQKLSILAVKGAEMLLFYQSLFQLRDTRYVREGKGWA